MFCGLYPAAQPGKRLPARVRLAFLAGAFLDIPVLAAARAKSFAVRLAQRPDRQGQKHLLAQHILKQKTVSLIIPDFGLGRCYRPLRRRRVHTLWPEDEVELRCERKINRLNTSRAGDLKLARKLPA